MSCGGGAWRSGGASSGRGVFLGPAGTDGNRLATGARQVRTQVTGGPAPQPDPFLLRGSPTSQQPSVLASTPPARSVCQSPAPSPAPPDAGHHPHPGMQTHPAPRSAPASPQPRVTCTRRPRLDLAVSITVLLPQSPPLSPALTKSRAFHMLLL